MMKSFFFSLLILIPAAVFAADGHSGGHGGLDEATKKTIIYQAINVGILVVAIAYFLKATVRQFFTDKQATYLTAANRAQAIRKEAEKEHMQVKMQLTKLESTADESRSRARAEAADLRNQMIAEAQAMSKRIQEEAQLTAKLEVEKAKNQLRAQMIQEAAELAEKTIQGKVSREDHQRLQDNFIQNIEAVRS